MSLLLLFSSINLLNLSDKDLYPITKLTRTRHVMKFIKQLRIVEELGLKLW